MRIGIVLVAAGGILTMADAPLWGQFKKGPKGEFEAIRYGWLSSLTEGKAKARQSGKPIMAVMRCVP